jgi:hypothetical protein
VTESQKAFDEALKNIPEQEVWNAHDLMLWFWNKAEAFGRKQALEGLEALADAADYYTVDGIDQYHIDATDLKGLIE